MKIFSRHSFIFHGISFVVLNVFLIWLFPLGSFVKPEADKKLCGGQRPICLCRHLTEEQKEKIVKAVLLKSLHHENSQERRSGMSVPSFLHVVLKYADRRNSVWHLRQTPLFYNNPFLKSIDHVPKV